MAKFIAGLAMSVLVITLSGCATVNVPDKIDVNYGGRPSRVDSTHIPQTRNHEECRAELVKAYNYIRSLERKNQKLEKDKDELKARLKQSKKYDD